MCVGAGPLGQCIHVPVLIKFASEEHDGAMTHCTAARLSDTCYLTFELLSRLSDRTASVTEAAQSVPDYCRPPTL
jgi:hypothetical protein